MSLWHLTGAEMFGAFIIVALLFYLITVFRD